jgi:protein-tyrosine phosphatase
VVDQTQGCINFRDVGLFVNLIAQKRLLPENRLLRGGKIDSMAASEIGSPGTIINLRTGADAGMPGADRYHFPIANDLEKYDTPRPDVRLWLNAIIGVFEAEDLRYPVLLHCFLGKDRTGVVIAAVLRILEVPESIIVEEYLLSEGDIDVARIRKALAGFRDLPSYFDRVDLAVVQANILRDFHAGQAGE